MTENQHASFSLTIAGARNFEDLNALVDILDKHFGESPQKDDLLIQIGKRRNALAEESVMEIA